MRFLGLLLAVLILPLIGTADERILSYHSDIEVHTNASMTVTETIRVRSEQLEIRRGIYRDFPTRYRDAHGNRVVVDFEVTAVARDDEPEPYALEDIRRGQRVKMGSADVVLPPGEYTYAITYRTNRQLGYFDDFDELYWNVTGNGWGFPIDQAGAHVVLPATIPPDTLKTGGYTGPEGSQETAYTVRAGEGTSVDFVTTRPLGPGEGLTIVVSWPKGRVYEPTRQERWGAFMRDNRSAAAAMVGFILMLGYYLVVWAMVGIDPARGTILPRFRPPEKLSPASARFLWKMGFDHGCFAAALIHLAVQGRIKLEEGDDTYTLLRTDNAADSPFPDEATLFTTLLGSRSFLELKPSNHETIGEALESLKEDLTKRHVRQDLLYNKEYWSPGILLLILTLVAVILLSRQIPIAAFMTFWLSFWTLGVAALVAAVYGQWKKVFSRRGGFADAFGALFLSVFALPFLAFEGFGLFTLSQAITPLAVLILACTAGLLPLFYHLLKAPTLLGRRLLDELEGFRLYLSVAERDRLQSMRSPKKTPELFESYLPYALALDVEQAWAEQFSDILADAGTADTSTYRPSWYDSTSGRSLTTAALVGAVGSSLASTISTSSTAPGSSSGGGGGGSSGGGGGGGGGGGW